MFWLVPFMSNVDPLPRTSCLLSPMMWSVAVSALSVVPSVTVVMPVKVLPLWEREITLLMFPDA